MKEVSLTQGKVAFVSDEDYVRVAQSKWMAEKWGNTWCATRRQYHPIFRPKKIYMHRFIMNAPDEMVVDHINGNGLDNRRENLRICTHAENIRNSRIPSNNSTGYKGVDFVDGKYRARIKVGGKHILIGKYDDSIEAAKAYDDAARKHFGRFARTNF